MELIELMNDDTDKLRFVWWNLASFAHFDADYNAMRRWPNTIDEYRGRRQRIAEVLREITSTESVALFAFGEITERAANDLRDELAPDYHVHSLDLIPPSAFHVAILFDPTLGGTPGVLTPQIVPRGTRSMAYVDLRWNSHRIRFYTCHWTARFEETSAETRQTLARELRIHAYDFLNREPQQNRHVIILGDLNEEPFELERSYLFASRERRFARRPHYTDEDTKKPRLYNCMWRCLGEKNPHRGTADHIDTAGTYYWRKENRWLTFDQIIVSGSLLHHNPPFLEEESIEVLTHERIRDQNGRPQAFEWNNGEPTGLSDHLPVCGTIRLKSEVAHG